MQTSIFEYRTSIIPFAVTAITDFLLVIGTIFLYAFSLHYSPESSPILLASMIQAMVLLYVMFIIPAIATIAHNFNKLRMKWWMIILSVVTYPFYFADLLLAFVHGLIIPKSRKVWKPIKHSGNIKDKRAKKVSKNAK